jgi:hypothetical protein
MHHIAIPTAPLLLLDPTPAWQAQQQQQQQHHQQSEQQQQQYPGA